MYAKVGQVGQGRETVRAVMPTARVLYRDSQGRDGEVPLRVGEPCVIGRALDCAIRTDDALVSRQHSVIRLEGERFFVEDLGSSNGTHVNDEKVAKHPLRHNDVVRCGSLWLRFVEEGPSDAEDADHSVTTPRTAGDRGEQPRQRDQATVGGKRNLVQELSQGAYLSIGPAAGSRPQSVPTLPPGNVTLAPPAPTVEEEVPQEVPAEDTKDDGLKAELEAAKAKYKLLADKLKHVESELSDAKDRLARELKSGASGDTTAQLDFARNPAALQDRAIAIHDELQASLLLAKTEICHLRHELSDGDGRDSAQAVGQAVDKALATMASLKSLGGG